VSVGRLCRAEFGPHLSAAHDEHHLAKAIDAFKKIGARHGILGLKKQQIIEKFGR
jgi:hypothetical protein